MRKILPLALFAVLLAGGVLASPVFDVLGLMPAATTSAYNLYNPNIRGNDGKLVSTQLTTSPQGCEIYISDGTGEAFTTPSAAVIKSATLSLVSAVRGSAVADGPNGTCTIKKPGLYQVTACVSDGVGANTGTQTVTVFQKIGAGAAAELSPAVKAVAVTLTAQPWIPLCQSGLVAVSAASAAATGNVIFDARATSSTGNMTVKQYRLRVMKVDELDPPSVP